MKNNHEKKSLTFGEFIASVYDACDKQKAGALVRFAVNAQLVAFRGQDLYVISENFKPGREHEYPA
jgi:hypothetical protein